jgi:hypothetical protein
MKITTVKVTVDIDLLRQQRNDLLRMKDGNQPDELDTLKGVINMIDVVLDRHDDIFPSPRKAPSGASGMLTGRVAGVGVSDGSTASYYMLPEGAKELQDIISVKDMNSQIGEIFRACMRYGEVPHSPKIRDAKKIHFYINAEIKRLEKYEVQADADST